MPLSWIFMIISSIFMLLALSTFNYFFYCPKPSLAPLNSNNQNFKWNWKW